MGFEPAPCFSFSKPKALAVDTHALIDDIIRNLRMDVSASEKSNYYNKYIRKMRLEIDDNGILKIKVQEE